MCLTLLFCVADEHDVQYGGQRDGASEQVEKLNSRFFFNLFFFIFETASMLVEIIYV
jgi:ABC-type cobalt transport system substrate-binding protein